MNFNINLSLFDQTPHTPSFGVLSEGLKGQTEILRDYCIPVNPYFPTPQIFAKLKAEIETTLKYYPATQTPISEKLAASIHIPAENIILGNGSTELITWINQLLIEESLAIPVPTFSRWTEDPLSTGKQVHMMPRLESADFALDVDSWVDFIRTTKARSAVICNPNNPTGAFLPTHEVLRMVDALAHLDVIIVDESFGDFVFENEIPSVAKEIIQRDNAIVLKSLGKNLGLHGIRAGYAVANTKLTSRLKKALPYWNLNAVAEWLIGELPKHAADYENSRRQVVRDRIQLERDLRQVSGLKVFPSFANFVYFKVPDVVDGVALRNYLLTEYGYLVRECGNKVGSSSQFFRVAARPNDERQYLISALRDTIQLPEVRRLNRTTLAQ